ncbi:DNA-binding response regulator [Microbulbifer flavimaris]|uniref:DNA-binding response regulator n=1 Tax=Microbulbifer flavimaris TaxID=1781068 RepID=A0ABX4I3Z5_9GAMM|nr:MULTISPECIES: response regulator transcription factor [Microbulbifer]KUJ84801.1 two-component system response regulator [Microbulbifer sp. ZGT114]PCO06898.1 DNA-binding response regulator [Microbulbifer flavimaris]
MNIFGASVLVIDPNPADREALAQLLRQSGFSVIQDDGAETTAASAAECRPDLVTLDIALPGADGFHLCRDLCNLDNAPPVLLISSRNDEIDRVLGLELGADDYVGKPYSPRELVARVKAILRRAKREIIRERPRAFAFNGWRFYPARMELLNPDTEVVPLSTSETALLLAFVQNPQTPLSRDRLLDLTKGRDSFPFDRSIDSHVSRLRRKLGDCARSPHTIKTAWGSGYIFSHAVES